MFYNLFKNKSFSKTILVVNATIWAAAFILVKGVFDVIEVGWLLGIRFLIASVCLYLFASNTINDHVDRKTILVGVMVGVFGWGGYLAQNAGLLFTTPGKNAFLTGTYVVIVPFVAFLRHMGKPKVFNVAGACVALIGLGFVALEGGFSLNFGDALTLVAALMYALQICEISKSADGLNTIAMTFFEFATMSLLSFVWGCAFESAPMFAQFRVSDWASLLVLGVVCSCFTTLTANLAYAQVDPTSGSILSSLEAPIGVALSLVLGYEVVSLRLVFGFLLILIGVLTSEIGENVLREYKERHHLEKSTSTTSQSFQGDFETHNESFIDKERELTDNIYIDI